MSLSVCCRPFKVRFHHVLNAFKRNYCCSILDGKELAKALRKNLREQVEEWVSKGHRTPHLTAILVGEDPASTSYVNIKMKAAKKVGIEATSIKCSGTIDEKSLLKIIDECNKDKDIDGILVQLPVPRNIRERVICDAISSHKDVDGFSATNMGRLTLNMPAMFPCTALAVLHIILSTGISVQGKTAVVCGRSKNVGLPIGLILHSQGSGAFSGLDMTTTICHRYTPPHQLAILTRNADFVISAAGVPRLIRRNMVKPGACVIDVGMTRVYDKDGKPKFIGDVDFEEVRKVAGTVTPVPGGVGPVTVAMLLKNTFTAAQLNSAATSLQIELPEPAI